MSASRESISPFVMVRLAVRFRRRPRWRDIRRTMHPRNLRSPLWWGDTFGPVLCWVMGHRRYTCSLAHEPTEWACSRCNRCVEP